MRKYKFIYKLIALIILLFLVRYYFAKKPDDITPPPIVMEATTLKNIVYKVVAPNDSLRLDLYLPVKAETSKPVMVFIHGGGWTLGDKSQIQSYYRQYVLQALLAEGFAVASIDYRLIGRSQHLDAVITDCQDAVRWLRKNASFYGLDSINIGLWGASAGGHLALMSAYTHSQSQTEALKNYNADVTFVIDNFGPTDLNDLLRPDLPAYQEKLLKLFAPEKYEMRNTKLFYTTGITEDVNKQMEQLKKYSPIHFVFENTVPTLIMHGSADKLVSLKQSETLFSLLQQKNPAHQFIIYKNAKHGFKNMDTVQIKKVTADILRFAVQQKGRK